MKNKTISLISILILLILFFCTDIYAKNNISKKQEKKIEQEEEDDKGYSILLGVSAGVFMAFGDDWWDILKPNYSIKAFVQYNNTRMGFFGIGLDIAYSHLEDRDNEGLIRFIPIIPFFSLTFSPRNILDLQAKAGAGVTVLMSELVNTDQELVKSVNADFTFAIGFVIKKVFKKHYAIGIEGIYNYIFEKKGLSTFGAYFFVGYQF